MKHINLPPRVYFICKLLTESIWNSRNLLLFLKAILVHSLKGTGRAAVLAASYIIKAWECPVDYAIDRLRLSRPVSIENSDQEMVLKQFHGQVSDRFQGYYARIQTKWSPQTEFLGKEQITTTFVEQPVNELFQQRIQQ